MDKDQQIGVTEAGEVAFNLDVFDRLRKANIIITKRLTRPLIEKLVEHKDKIILHLTCTGMGGTKIEPLVPSKEQTRKMFNELIGAGFPVSHVVLRVDPVITTNKGVATALKVIKLFRDSGIKRVRYSSIDMYDHVKERFQQAKIALPHSTFHANYSNRMALFDMLKVAVFMCDMGEIEACGEPDVASMPCVSAKDLKILGLADEIKLVDEKGQRKTCHCPSNKVELITGQKPKRCENGCLYCFWKDDNENKSK